MPDYFSSNNASLFRLINSPAVSSWILLEYLWKHKKKETGLQHHILTRLKSFPSSEINSILPQLCHILCSNHWESAPLEYFIINYAKQNRHAAIYILWTIESYINDFAKEYSDYRFLFARSIRILGNIQKAIFNTGKSFSKKKTQTIPGLAVNLVSIGLGPLSLMFPSFVDEVCAPMLLGNNIPIDLAPSSLIPSAVVKKKMNALTKQGSFEVINTNNQSNESMMSPTIEELSSGSAFQLIKNYIKRVDVSLSSQSLDFIKSTSSINNQNRKKNNDNNSIDRKFYKHNDIISFIYYSEQQFINSLLDISNRLENIAIDKRLTTLFMELSLINHNLPAPICLPINCDGKNIHHHLLRICTSEAVVLNSAERTPFLLLLEVLDVDDGMSDNDFHEMISSVKGGLSTTGIQQFPIKKEEEEDDFQMMDEFKESISSFKLFSDCEISKKMRTAAIMLAQLTRKSTSSNITKPQSLELERIREGIIREMEHLEKERLIDALHNAEGDDEFRVRLEVEEDSYISLDQRPLFDKEDPSCSVLAENWTEKYSRIREASPYGSLRGWRLMSIIVKSGIDMRQEQLASQIISLMSTIWNDSKLNLWVRPYHILATSSSGAIIETITNSLSLHSIKKMAFKKSQKGGGGGGEGFTFSLRDHFIEKFGKANSLEFCSAQNCFIESLASYSIITYILQIRDRHDGNILIDDKGHLIHIDFGFMLSNSPGYVGIETAPFKMTPEYIELIGGMNSEGMKYFRKLFFEGFIELRKYSHRFITTIEIMQEESHLPCFDQNGESASINVRNRFHLGLTDIQLRIVLEKLIISSAYNLFTKLYDSFQYFSNGVF